MTERKFFISEDNVVGDLSNNNLLDNTLASQLGKHTYLSKDNTYCFISSNNSIYNSSTNNIGDVFVYKFNNTTKTWSFENSLYQYAHSSLTNHDGSYSSKFGSFVIANNDTTKIFVGVPGYRTSNVHHGAVCVFERANSSWSFKELITSNDSNGNLILAHSYFGASLSCNSTGNTLFIGTDTISNSSAANVYKFDLSSNTYTKDTNFDIKPTMLGNSNFGNYLDCDDNADYLVVGSDYFAKSIDGNTRYTGSVHIYNKDINNNWSLLKECYEDISNNSPYSGAVISNGASIGKVVSISDDGTKLFISTALTAINSGGKYGVVYYFEFNNSTSTYDYKSKLNPNSFNSLSKLFGESLQISGDGTHAIISTLDDRVDTYNYDASTTPYWFVNSTSTATQNIISDINTNSNYYTNGGVLDDFGSSVSISYNAKFISVGIKSYRYNSPTTSFSNRLGQTIIMRSKIYQTVSFSDISKGYKSDFSLNATTNSSSTPTYNDPDSGNNQVYQLDTNTNKITINGIGTHDIKVTYSEDSEYLELSKTVQVTGTKANQDITYTAAITTQGYIGIGQISGISFTVNNTSANIVSELTAAMNISDPFVTFDSQNNEFTGIAEGVATVTLTQSGNTFYNAATPVTLTYDVKINMSSSGGATQTQTNLINDGIENVQIDSIKKGFASLENNIGVISNDALNSIESIIFGEDNLILRRKKRLNTLKLLFEQNNTVKSFKMAKAKLSLPDTFIKENARVIKAGETFNITNLNSDEGFYSVLNNGESVSLALTSTTVTFTRNDLNDNEQYEISYTGDPVINTDDVQTGTNKFSPTNINGILVPDDIFIIDGRKLFISSVGDGGSTGSGGDPYIFPIKSKIPVKLPNKSAVYRMFEQDDNYINVEVDKASNEHQQRMIKYAIERTPVIHNIVCNGYFYKKTFIYAEGHKLIVDYTKKQATCAKESLSFFNIHRCKKLFDCGEFMEDVDCYNIEWKTKENNKIKTEILFFPNPHIENGINIIPQTLKKSTGLIVNNFKPKLMELPSLTTVKYPKIKKRLNKKNNLYQNMNIKSKNEKWLFSK